LVVTVVEHLPIAFVSTERGLLAFDEHGRQLPLDPSRVAVDLPIAARRDTALFRLLANVRAERPRLFARVSEIKRVGDGEVVLHLESLPIRAMLDVTPDRLAEIFPVEADLAKRRARVAELDLRFRDQVIARLQ
jgi:cell division protein FtsQ